MRILSLEVVEVKRHLGMVDKPLEELVYEVEVELTHELTLPITVKLKYWAAREVDHHSGEGLIEWDIGMAVAGHPLLVANCLCKGLAQADANVLNGVMGVDFKVTLGADDEIDHAMARNLIEHVIEKCDTGIQLALAGAIELDFHANLRLRSVALDVCGSHRPDDTVAR